MDEIEPTRPDGLSRRDVLRRGAMFGGALVWTVPAVQTIAGPAFAAGTSCVGCVEFTRRNGITTFTSFGGDEACCDCVATFEPTFGLIVAVALCVLQNSCQITAAGVGKCP